MLRSSPHRILHCAFRLIRLFSSSDLPEKVSTDWDELSKRSSEMKDNITRRRLSLEPSSVDELLSLHSRYKQVVGDYQLSQQEKKKNAKDLSQLSNMSSPTEKEKLLELGLNLKRKGVEIANLKYKLSSEIKQIAHQLPNWTHPSAPLTTETVVGWIGGKDSDNPAVKSLDPKRHCHLRIGEVHKMFMWPEVTQATGTRYAVLCNFAALLEMALVQMVLQRLTFKHQFVPLLPPDVVKPSYASACGFQPRGEHTQIYHIENEGLCLAGTSEISIAALNSQRLISQKDLPHRFAAF